VHFGLLVYLREGINNLLLIITFALRTDIDFLDLISQRVKFPSPSF
jgi:hypothetical protein